MARINIVNADNKIESNPRRAYFQLKNTGGPKGDTGAQGPQGPKGDTGAQGPAGLSASVTVGSTTTLAPGASATVTNSGDTRNAVLNFGIPTGAQGPQGIQGPKGDTGPEGAKGAKGDTGAAATVAVNATNTGAPGTNAEVQNLGDEHNAVLQFTIPRGDKGETGATGATGAQGEPGESFTPTVVTALPETGDPSAIYFTEKAHTTQTATGNPITATITDEAGKMESFQLDGDTFQQSYEGKNLLGLGQPANTQGLTVSVDELNNNITVRGTATGSYPHLSDKPNGLDIPAGTYTLSIKNAVAYAVSARLYRDDGTYPTGIGSFIPAGSTSCTFSIDFDCHRVELLMGGVSSGTVVPQTTISDIMLEAGSTPTSFEPYVGGMPSPNPQYPQPIQTVTGTQTVTVIGKNLFDKSNPNDLKAYISDGGVIMTGGSYNLSVYIPCLPNTTYTVSKTNSGTNNRFCVFDTEVEPAIGGRVISTVGARSGEDNNTSYTITTSANAHYLGVFYRVSSTTPSEDDLKATIQIEIGSTATAYTPYYKQTLPLELGAIELCKLNTYQDYIWKDGNDWKVHKETAYDTRNVRINGISGNSSSDTTASAKGAFAVVSFTDGWTGDYATTLGIATLSANIGQFKLNTSVTGNAAAENMDDGTFCQRQGTNDRCYFKATSLIGKTGNEVKAILAVQGGVNAWWGLETPTETTITDAALIAQLEAIRTALLQNGANTIANSATSPNLAGDMEIGYYGYTPSSQYDKWIWLNVGAAGAHYEQL